MEPLDINLANKLKKISAAYEADEIKKTKKVDKVFVSPESLSLEEQLRRYVVLCRNRTTSIVQKVDNADYDLTAYILEAIEDACMCSLADLRNGKRDNGLTVARAIYTFIERRLNKRSYPEIGAIMKKDHTSCIYLSERLAEYKTGKIFQVYMRNEKLKHLYECAERGEWSWSK